MKQLLELLWKQVTQLHGLPAKKRSAWTRDPIKITVRTPRGANAPFRSVKSACQGLDAKDAENQQSREADAPIDAKRGGQRLARDRHTSRVCAGELRSQRLNQ